LREFQSKRGQGKGIPLHGISLRSKSEKATKAKGIPFHGISLRSKSEKGKNDYLSSQNSVWIPAYAE